MRDFNYEVNFKLSMKNPPEESQVASLELWRYTKPKPTEEPGKDQFKLKKHQITVLSLNELPKFLLYDNENLYRGWSTPHGVLPSRCSKPAEEVVCGGVA